MRTVLLTEGRFPQVLAQGVAAVTRGGSYLQPIV
jgi:hypothetical protein